MLKRRQHRQNLPHHPIFRLDRLVRVGVRANRNRRHLIGPAPQLPLQHPRNPRPRNQPRLKIQARRQVQIGMRRPCKAINAAMFAAPIGVDRPVKRQVGRAVVGHSRPGPLHPHLGLDQSILLRHIPTVIERDPMCRFKPPRIVAVGPPRPQTLTGQKAVFLGLHGLKLEQIRNYCQRNLHAPPLLSAFIKGMSQRAKSARVFRPIDR